MLAYFVFFEMQMIMNTDYGKILIVFGLIVPVKMNLVTSYSAAMLLLEGR